MQIQKVIPIQDLSVFEFRRSRDSWASAKIVPQDPRAPKHNRCVVVLTDLGKFVMTETGCGLDFQVENAAVGAALEALIRDMGPVDPKPQGEFLGDKEAFNQLSARFRSLADKASSVIYEAVHNSDMTEGKGHDVVMGRFTKAVEADKTVTGMGTMFLGNGRVREVAVYPTFEAWVASSESNGLREHHPLLDPVKKLRMQAFAKLTPEEREALGVKSPF